MTDRKEYEMSKKQLDKLLDACKPTPVMYLSGGTPVARSAQQRANDAWDDLGREMGFIGSTARPVNGKGQRFFTAIPVEESPPDDE